MRQFGFVVCALCCFAANSFGQRSDLLKAKAQSCLKPWVDAVGYIAQKSPTNKDIQQIQAIISNSMIAEPAVDKKGQLAFRYVYTTVNIEKTVMSLVPICSMENLPPVWKERFAHKNFTAEAIPFQNVLILGNGLKLPILYRGLVFLHEMRHAYQNWNPLPSKDSPDYHLNKELDAYEFEFKIFDELNLPEYNSLINSEITRFKKEPPGSGLSPNLSDPRVGKIFQSADQNPMIRQVLATEIFIRAIFKLYDTQNPNEVAFQKKIAFLRSIGYK
mgnify:CR=1 FL=1